MLAVGGCGRSIRAVETTDQLVSHKHRTATVNTPRFEVTATWTPVPWAGSDGPIAFLLQIANLSEYAVRFDLEGVTLEDGFGRLRGVIPPEKLYRAFSISSADEPPRAALASYRRTVRYSRYYYDYYPEHRFYAWHGGLGWPVGGAYDYDPYYEQRKTARFLAQLLESQTLAPQSVALGYVVFAYDPQKDDKLTLRIEIGPRVEETSTQPAEITTVSMIFEVR
ncbi:MAG: hypothetical protein V2A79_09100 [Planctomycetota bacterium]